MYDFDFGYNPSYAQTYQGKQISGQIRYDIPEYPFTTPQTQSFSALFTSFAFNPVNKSVSAYMVFDVNNFMNGEIISYNSGTGQLVVDCKTFTGSGTYSCI